MHRRPCLPSESSYPPPALKRVLVFAAALFCACRSEPVPVALEDAGACIGADFEGAPIGVRCGALVDREGRTVLLHGVNARAQGVFDVSFDDGRLPNEEIPPFLSEDARRIRALGFNALRLPINWSAIEPYENAGFSSAYIDRIATIVRICRTVGVGVLLDIHQDAYSKEIGEDGAPLWAIVPPPVQKLGGPMHDLAARRESKQVADAFATFFGASDEGARLRARFTAMAAYVMKRFAADEGVIGLEIFNEPITSDASLVPFHKEVLAAVRAVAPKKLVLFEPNAVRNITDKAPIGSGAIGPGTAYAPHVYSFVFTGSAESRAAITKEQLRPSNESARAEAEGFEAPLVITEWGYGPAEPNFASYVRWQQELQDEQRASAFYWLWKETSQGAWGFFDRDDVGRWVERPNVVNALSWVRAEAIAGRILSLKFDPDARRFEARFTGDANVKAPNLVSIGARPGFDTYEITCDGMPLEVARTEPMAIPCNGPGAHTIVVQGR
jgi:hypothetical protein